MTTLLKLWNPRLELIKKCNANNKTKKKLPTHNLSEYSSSSEEKDDNIKSKLIKDNNNECYEDNNVFNLKGKC